MLKDSIDADEQDTYLIDYLFDLNGLYHPQERDRRG